MSEEKENKENKTAAFLRKRSRFSRRPSLRKKNWRTKSRVRVIDASLGGDRSTMLLSTILSSKRCGTVRRNWSDCIGFSTRWENWIEIEIARWKFAFSRHTALRRPWKLWLCRRSARLETQTKSSVILNSVIWFHTTKFSVTWRNENNSKLQTWYNYAWKNRNLFIKIVEVEFNEFYMDYKICLGFWRWAEQISWICFKLMFFCFERNKLTETLLQKVVTVLNGRSCVRCVPVVEFGDLYPLC